MPQLYVYADDAFQVTDSNGNILTNFQDLSGDWTVDDQNVAGSPPGGDAAQDWLTAGAYITFTDKSTLIDIIDNDADFEDDDVSPFSRAQRLDGQQTIGDTTYAGDTRIEAEFYITVTDGNTTWTLSAVNLGGSGGQNFQTVEGFAVVNDGNGVPPRDVPLQIISTTDLEPPDPDTGTGSASYDDYVFVCFTADTMIETDLGTKAAKDLEKGDMVKTVDNGFQPIRWIGKNKVIPSQKMQPICICKGFLNADTDLMVSPQHRILLSGPMAELMFGEAEVLVAAKDLLGFDQVYRANLNDITYVHFMFDQHELVYSNSVISESLLANDYSISLLGEEARDEMLSIFPELGNEKGPRMQAARYVLNKHEAESLVKRL